VRRCRVDPKIYSPKSPMHKTLCGILMLFAVFSEVQPQTVNAAVNAASFPGPDMGAKINGAIASLPHGCGEVNVPSGNYAQSTTVIVSRCTKLHGEGPFATTLRWTPTGGTALLVEDSGGALNYPEGEVADITFSGPGYAIGTTTGLYLGGVPRDLPFFAIYSSGLVCSTTNFSVGCPTLPIPSTGFADHFNFNRIKVAGFVTGVQWGFNAWSQTFSQSIITNNGTGIYFPNLYSSSNSPNSGESIGFISTSIQNNQIGMNLVGFSDFYFYASRCDYNITCGNVNHADFYGEHFEQASGTILTITGTSQPIVNIFGGWALFAGLTGSDPQMFYVNSSLNPTLRLDGIFLSSTHPVANAVNWNGSGGEAILSIQDMPYYVPGGNIAALTNANCNFWGCRIEDGHGTLAFSGRNARLLANGAASFQSLTLSNGSTAISRYAKYSASLSPAAVAANTCAAQNVTVVGVRAGDVVIKAEKPSEQAGLALIGGRATAANTVSLQFCNNTAAIISPAANEKYVFEIVQ